MKRRIIVTDGLIYFPEKTGSEIQVIRPGEILRASMMYCESGRHGVIFMTLDKEESNSIIETSSRGLTDNRGLRDFRRLLLGNGYRELESQNPDELISLIKPVRLMRDGISLYGWAKNDWNHLLTIFSNDRWAEVEAVCGDLMEK